MAVRLIEQLVQQTHAHFAHEEEAMEEAHFPDLEAHATEHAALIRRAQEILRQFRSGAISALVFPSFFRDWLIPHMRDYDRKYSAALRRHGMR